MHYSVASRLAAAGSGWQRPAAAGLRCQYWLLLLLDCWLLLHFFVVGEWFIDLSVMLVVKGFNQFFFMLNRFSLLSIFVPHNLLLGMAHNCVMNAKIYPCLETVNQIPQTLQYKEERDPQRAAKGVFSDKTGPFLGPQLPRKGTI